MSSYDGEDSTSCLEEWLPDEFAQFMTEWVAFRAKHGHSKTGDGRVHRNGVKISKRIETPGGITE